MKLKNEKKSFEKEMMAAGLVPNLVAAFVLTVYVSAF